MTGWLTAPVGELFGDDATAEEAYGLLTVDVPPSSWPAALRTARSGLGCTYFDWLSAVDEPDTGFRVAAHVVALGPVRRLLLRTTVPHEAPVLASAVEVYAGAAWHERETHEMFGIDFEGHPHLVPLLLPEGFEGHPLRKDFVLAARVVKAWPGAKEPGESGHGGPRRRQTLPPGVPDPNEWGPQKGTLPAAPTRPARAARAAGERTGRTGRTERAAGDVADAPGRPAGGGTRPRRARSASGGSASQRTAQDTAPHQPTQGGASGSGSQGDASGTGSQGGVPGAGSRENAPRRAPEDTAGNRRPGDDAPWHHARPAFDEPGAPRTGSTDTTDTGTGTTDAETAEAATTGADPADNGTAGTGTPDTGATGTPDTRAGRTRGEDPEGGTG
ncbi:dehydrogenase [Streptomyces sulfonofaciens]|uniref:Dehydrogenase n=1 Tax=Streptomyces sulfonofaciens TaxID=68272 RepID=A0A919L0M7_9ACTN|nr:NADH-quinone oxidoreductase subunit C [Streptomyces sulfonofaciens]GHH78341.1 dehydrogenase [Streptomyces sulfonofaciens]